jgi:hypothetical protein
MLEYLTTIPLAIHKSTFRVGDIVRYDKNEYRGQEPEYCEVLKLNKERVTVRKMIERHDYSK